MKIVFEGSQTEVIAEIIAMATTLAPVKLGAVVNVPDTQGEPDLDRIAEREAGKEDPPVETSGRKPGFPAEGKTRRTQAQIKEDNDYFAAQDKPAGEEQTTTEPEKPVDPEATGEALTLDDVRNKLKMVVSMTSMKRGQELVAEFEASRITELPEEKFAAFIARCEVVAEEG